MPKLVFKNSRSVIIENLEIADTFMKRFLGLINRPCPKENEGLVFFNCSSIHMFFMKYPIAVLFLDMNGFVVKCIDALKPWRIATSMNSCTTIEMAPGFFSKNNVCIGDQLEILGVK